MFQVFNFFAILPKSVLISLLYLHPNTLQLAMLPREWKGVP